MQQLEIILDQGIITHSKSPWMAPADFVPKKSSQLRICIDYRELNKRTTKDSYPLPLPDKVQDRLAGSIIFSTLDLHSRYQQLPRYPKDITDHQTNTAHDVITCGQVLSERGKCNT